MNGSTKYYMNVFTMQIKPLEQLYKEERQKCGFNKPASKALEYVKNGIKEGLYIQSVGQ